MNQNEGTRGESKIAHDNKRIWLLNGTVMEYKCSSDFTEVCEHIIKLVTKRKTQVKKRDMVTQKYIHPLIRQANKQIKPHTPLRYE